MPTATAVRTEEVVPPSARRETALVVRAAFLVAFWSAMAIGLERGAEAPRAPGPSAPAPAAAVAFAALTSEEQRVYLRLREGLNELEDSRAQTGHWPEVAALVEGGVPPFAPEPLDRGYGPWTLVREGTVVNYRVAPLAGAGRSGFVLAIVEPEPGAAPDPAPPDDVHHRLADGTMLHVTIWIGPGVPDDAPAAELFSPARGWRQILP